jgi:acid stress-induced BolA-like protein IbaG/YrbA
MNVRILVEIDLSDVESLGDAELLVDETVSDALNGLDNVQRYQIIEAAVLED